MGKVIHAHFGGECVACLARRDGDAEANALTMLLMSWQGVPKEQIFDDMCVEHQKVFLAAYRDWLEEASPASPHPGD